EAQGQSLTFYPAGEDRLSALIDLIDGARTSFRAFYYMYGDDACGVKVRDALVRAAERGVDVSLAIDGFGSDKVEDEFFAPLVKAGGRFDRFQAKWSRRSLIRNHQKLAIADRKRAMIGGFNVEQGYFAPPDQNGWHDLGLIVEGSAVETLDAWMDRLDGWIEDDEAQFRSIVRTVKEWDGGVEGSGGAVRLLIGGPTRHLSSWAQCVQRDLEKGRRLDMVMAYFSPPMKLLRRIGRIAEEGETRLIMAAKSDNGATIGATRSLYDYLLKKRARILEFAPCKLHMKIVVLDDAVYLGSANFDMRSLYINLELMLRIEDRGLADRMRDFIAAHEHASNRITLAEHRRKAGLWNRIRWNVSWFLVTVMDYNVSRGLNLGL
ncbi:MAG: phospholipase D-like domain-containing protein, partial [Erythrobacter sp.]|nr:phospholipase D-like domain-containing protein [Erythrobacter sp.]